MSYFCCPICKLPLEGQNTLRCRNNHCYDKAKSGYVNLLSGKGGNHGDSKEMILSRKSFLEKGYYDKLADNLCEAVLKYGKGCPKILDAGCGECYYTEKIAAAFESQGRKADFLGIDVSKDAVNYAAKRFPACELACASVYAMPLEDSSVDTVLSVFAPAAINEFWRVLSPNGFLIMVIGAENHLWSLKKAVYDTPYKNQTSDYFLEGFEIIEKIEVGYEMELSQNKDIMDLFVMTPYYHKTSAKDIEKLRELDHLTTETDFQILIYKRQNVFGFRPTSSKGFVCSDYSKNKI